MTRPVPHRRPTASVTDVRVGRAVRGPTWQQAALLNNWVHGRGAQLVPLYSPVVQLTGSTKYELRFRVTPNYQTLERLWSIYAVAVDKPETVSVTVPAGGTTFVKHVPFIRNEAVPQTVHEALSAQSGAETTLSIELEPSGDINLRGLGCWELPRATLAQGGSDRGMDNTHFNPGGLIGATPLAPLVATMADGSAGRRASLLQWAVPVLAGGATTTAFAASTTSASHVDIFALPTPVLGRKLGVTDTTKTVTCKVLHWSSDGASTTGTARLNSSKNGASSTVTVGGTTTPTWSDAITLAVDAEDPTVADGRRGSTWDELDVQWARTSGAGTLYIASVSIWEA